MKGNVFIGWSRNKNLAVKIKAIIEKEGYSAIVGGDFEHNRGGRQMMDMTVYGTVTKQMSRCDQALMLFQERDASIEGNSSDISGNLVFELGFLSSRLTYERVHIFKIDIGSDAEYRLFPSDLHGIWGRYIGVQGRSEDEIAHEITYEFLRKQAYICNTFESKFLILSDPYSIAYEMGVHNNRPGCSDYELALNLIFYTQSAYVHQNVATIEMQCRDLKSKMSPEERMISHELANSIELSLITCKLFKAAIPDENKGGAVCMSASALLEFIELFKDIICRIMNNSTTDTDCSFCFEELRLDDETDDFKRWAVTQSQHYVTYLYLVYLDNPEISGAERYRLSQEAIKYGLTFIENCIALSADPSNAAYAMLLRAFVCRNLFKFYSMTGDKENEEKFDTNALITRRSLYRSVEGMKDINDDLRDSIALEYFSHLAESAHLNKSPLDIINDIGDYIERRKKTESTKTVVLKRLINAHDDIKSRHSLEAE